MPKNFQKIFAQKREIEAFEIFFCEINGGGGKGGEKKIEN